MGTFTKRYLKQRGPAKAYKHPDVLAIYVTEGKAPSNTHTSKAMHTKSVTKQVIVGNKVTVQRVKYDPTTVNTRSIGKVCQHKDVIPDAWNYTASDKVKSMGLCGTNPFS